MRETHLCCRLFCNFCINFLHIMLNVYQLLFLLNFLLCLQTFLGSSSGKRPINCTFNSIGNQQFVMLWQWYIFFCWLNRWTLIRQRCLNPLHRLRRFNKISVRLQLNVKWTCSMINGFGLVVIYLRHAQQLWRDNYWMCPLFL